MKSKLHSSLFVLAWLALFTLNSELSTARAQGKTFTYAGQLQDDGSLASGAYDLTFALFTTNANGVAVAGPLTNDAVGVTNGLFTVLINFGSKAFTGKTNWLQIGVATNGDTNFTLLSPRQELTPTPYAIFAETASNLSSPTNITLHAGPGLSGGGKVSLGSSTTLSNTGVLSIIGNADITVSRIFGAVTLGDTATNTSTPKTIVKRDGSGNFSAATITLSGNLKLPATGASPDIIYSGANLLLYGDSNANFFSGQNAGNMMTTGSNNTAIGAQALQNNTSGLFNTALGFDALYNNTNGNYNTAIGYGALNNNLTGSANTALGLEALLSNTNGSENTAIGFEALTTNTSGS